MPDAELAEHAASLAFQLNHPVYDCIYLALALQLDGKLVTADRPFAEAVRRHHAFADWPHVARGRGAGGGRPAF